MSTKLFFSDLDNWPYFTNDCIVFVKNTNNRETSNSICLHGKSQAKFLSSYQYYYNKPIYVLDA